MLDHPYLRWQLGAHRTWADDDAVLSAIFRAHRVGLVGVGAAEAHPALVEAAMRELAAEGYASFRITTHPDAYELLPMRASTDAEPSYWQWMLADRPPPGGSGDAGWLDDADEPDVSALLESHSDRAHARPGDPDVLGWAGIRRHGRLLAAGAMVASPAGFPHLRAIVVESAQRHRGLGRAVSAFLTREGLDRSPVVSLSVYSDNHPAIGLYERLGYATRARFASFDVALDAHR